MKSIFRCVRKAFSSSFLILFAVALLSSCKYYKNYVMYDYKFVEDDKKEKVEKKQFWLYQKFVSKPIYAKKKMFIHQGARVWELKNFYVDLDNNKLTGNFAPIDSVEYSKFRKYIDREFVDNRIYKKLPDELYYSINQTHVYLFDTVTFRQNPSIEIPFSSVSELNDYRHNTKKEHGIITTSIVIPAAAAGVAAIGYVIYSIATACNCPYVYTSNGTDFNFSGTFYTGAVYKNLERLDYMKIENIDESQNEVQIKIRNKKKEHQFINLVGLTVVQHSKDVAVIPDSKGEFHTISKTNLPIFANDGTGKNCLNEISTKDDNQFKFDTDQNSDPLNHLELSFLKPIASTEAKLVLNAKNSKWAGYAYDQICQLAGKNYAKWVEKQSTKSKEDLINSGEKQGLPLLVYLKTTKGWEFVDYFNVVGELAPRDLVMKINLANVKSDTVQIMLKSAFAFWNVDFAAIDFSKDEPIHIQSIPPYSALDSLGTDHTTELSQDDSLYLKQYNINDEVLVKFKTPAKDPNFEQTIFLAGKGYYNRLNEYKGKTQFAELNKIRKPGGFSLYSKQMYFELISQLASVARAKNNGK